MSIYIGTCGFSYPDWEGHFYPPAMPPRDRLAYYAERFRAVELDSFFYHLPRPEVVEKMVKRTRKEFRFAVKLHRSVTHDFDMAAAEFGAFKKAVAPIAQAGRLGAVLAQFPPAFTCTRDAVQTLRLIREEFEELPLTVEFRHSSWNRPETFEFLQKYDIAYCAVDEPELDGLMPPVIVRTAEFAYVRLHGRNTARWLHARKAAERHNYLYNSEELYGWAERIEEVGRPANDVYVMFSNVYEAKAVTNARDLMQRLGLPVTPFDRRMERTGQVEMSLS
jgi:uncharacterized protein YecE (DUF72 family)